ncbi:MAG: hypothetical protein K6F43_05370 [Prevotella sp.]|nr:hypothetical protein [Prevotella sp.]
MKKILLIAGMALAMTTVMAQDNPYIVKTKGVKKEKTEAHQHSTDEAEPTDFMGKNFRYYSMCDWKEGMRFMVVPDKYDLLVNTFHDAVTKKEVGNGTLRHRIMVYQGYSMLSNGRVHINFTCEDDGKSYYYEQPFGTFEEYCYTKSGVPTLAYLGDVDKARELLMNQPLLTRTQKFRVDTQYDGDGYREITVAKNMLVTVKAIGVGTRAFPVKIIVEDENGHQFYQNVAMSRTNSGLREDGFYDASQYSFAGSFEFLGANMTVSSNVREYLNKIVHTKYIATMSSMGSGKVRDVKVPRFTGFIIDEITPVRNSKYYTLTMRETDSRRVYYKDVVFNEDDIAGGASGPREDFFGYLFGLGEGEARNTSKESRAAIREGRVIADMTKEEVELALGEPFKKTFDAEGGEVWLYTRSNDVILDVWFDEKGYVTQAKARKASDEPVKNANKNKRSAKSRGGKSSNTKTQTKPLTPLETMHSE